VPIDICTNGQKEKYIVTDNHVPIISREDFEKAQQLKGNLRKIR
jgi:hypothetical protein